MTTSALASALPPVSISASVLHPAHTTKIPTPKSMGKKKRKKKIEKSTINYIINIKTGVINVKLNVDENISINIHKTIPIKNTSTPT